MTGASRAPTYPRPPAGFSTAHRRRSVMAILDLQTLELPETEAHPIDDTLASTSSLSVLNCGTSTVSTLVCL
ncbi:hypothetical protein SSAG_00639 [Streptomyces sp. Mg1]|nr:hypothetical protein SSAG_00639 [Streptomyces sp. Mg1]